MLLIIQEIVEVRESFSIAYHPLFELSMGCNSMQIGSEKMDNKNIILMIITVKSCSTAIRDIRTDFRRNKLNLILKGDNQDV